VPWEDIYIYIYIYIVYSFELRIEILQKVSCGSYFMVVIAR